MGGPDDSAPPAPPVPHGRAGRNLGAATGVAVALGAVIIASLFIEKVAFVWLVGAVIAIAVWELSTALGLRDIQVPVVPVVLGAVALLGSAYVGGTEAMVVALALTVLAVLVWRLGEPQPGYLRDVSAGAFTTLYVPFLAGFAVLLVQPDDGAWRVVTFLLVVSASDTGGYAFGVLFGKHPMAPRVSPKKSWEGFVGSTLLCVVVGVITVVLLLDGRWWVGIVLGVATLVSATLGDLGESMIKRDLGIKDMGTLLPGHGGIMDRLDSLLPSAPVVWLVLTWLVPA